MEAQKREECIARDKARGRFLIYMRGWRHGTTFRHFERVEDGLQADYEKGYTDGRLASRAAAEAAEKLYDYKQIVLHLSAGES